ncbi:transcriptional regulator [Candidatus Parcubacteria bacterium]|nr:MAG: transcriptional regulator [Candidatus Parcubacteria bacterium]
MPSPESIANEFLEVASEQRLNALFLLNKEKMNLAGMARRLDATSSELHRNFGRMQKAGMIKKDAGGNYELTLYGKTICAQIPTFSFMIRNKKYFENHSFWDLSIKYVQRIGALLESEQIVGYVKVMEQWESIYKNAKEYICNILIETPYNEKLLKIIDSKLSNKIKILSIFSESAIVPKERQELLTKFNFSKFVKDEILQRKMKKDAKVALILNEKEAGLSFPTDSGEPDLSKMFYSTDNLFHEWCLDFFNDVWKVSNTFQEAKIGKS